MPEHDKETLARKMQQITAMLALADHPNTPEGEANAARARAEIMMRKYRIEESELIESGALDSELVKPGSKIIIVCPWESDYLNTYWTMINYVASHAECRMAQGTEYVDGIICLSVTLVGYEADLRYAETIFTNAKITFSDRMEPKPKADLSDEDNVYRMRNAGIERIRIAVMMGYGDTNSATAKVTRLYKAACKARGEDAVLTGRSMSVVNFREAYQHEFKQTLWMRLYNARNAAASGNDGGLVLANRKDRVDEAFYTMFPHLRPVDESKHIGENTKRKSTREWKATKADLARAERLRSAAGQAGRRAGNRAASEIDVGGGSGRKHVE